MHFNKQHTYLVVMAGGIGSRFWPMSTPERPKQFHDVLKKGATLFKDTVSRFSELIDPQNVYVVTSLSYVNFIQEQMPEIPLENILAEPCRRNTAPCVAFAAFKIHQKDPDAVIVVTPADHYVRDVNGFVKVVSDGLNWLSENNSSLLTLGIKPDKPETGYGYIEVEEFDDEKAMPVKSFKEKPDFRTAITYLEAGNFFWNSGIFIWHANTILNSYKEHLPEVYSLFNDYFKASSRADLENTYAKSPAISIDYGILEKADNIFVIAVNCGWSDLGTWSALWEMEEHDQNGNSLTNGNIQLYSTNNTIVRIPDDKQAIIKGLDNYIIVLDDKNLLIFNKDDEQKIGDYSKKLNAKNE